MQEINFFLSSVREFYNDCDSVTKDIKRLQIKYPKLKIGITLSKYSSHQYISLEGFLPIVYERKVFGVPMLIAFTYNYPLSPPELSCFISQGMEIVKNHPLVKEDGFIQNIQQQWNSSTDLLLLLERLLAFFGSIPPVRKNAQLSPFLYSKSNSFTPNPTTSYQQYLTQQSNLLYSTNNPTYQQQMSSTTQYYPYQNQYPSYQNIHNPYLPYSHPQYTPNQYPSLSNPLLSPQSSTFITPQQYQNEIRSSTKISNTNITDYYVQDYDHSKEKTLTNPSELQQQNNTFTKYKQSEQEQTTLNENYNFVSPYNQYYINKEGVQNNLMKKDQIQQMKDSIIYSINQTKEEIESLQQWISNNPLPKDVSLIDDFKKQINKEQMEKFTIQSKIKAMNDLLETLGEVVGNETVPIDKSLLIIRGIAENKFELKKQLMQLNY
ncbi:hypothetical protein EHI8A_057400 [Entamoeba histolytica HM-1:IMSS-B]|uniref:UEV domain-containing protein n=6 Tax=Entamoeba histolytica TaxID=5759 RepID=C4LZT6_ENTH1|nr:hypothetical protein EHI_194210 [Entamoeba histolytica HM-1:IMSS]EMD48199.1 tumor susceptibility gene 101 protein (TSG101) domain containing protein [Entamoeba histolytica KU27]EMH72482.1 hypothetical protein EHI8A_057400 [Entamoeba histolytica HM-1:IMSS-B]EMS13669.1 tumor susceptibility domain containing protein [Entamoeba histolytica HM-3:IMSS]ENY65475.1 tumor susceptibility domain containing protein, putative [Entamoeba histolytica HM-1:IMSS-A]GAT94394.1 hypothetical protein CL6EHI_19421|eukprot:XP_654716.1 hypothetical protein EHI_194210 [Entamoeba histolytica HM-1:IMSS]